MKVDLASNRGIEVYKSPNDTEIMAVNTNLSGTKLYFREGKRLGEIKGGGSRGVGIVEMEYHSYILDLNTGYHGSLR